MKEEYVSYDQASALKKLGFNEPCIAFYNKKELIFHTHGIDPHFIFKKNSDLWDSTSAPLKQQVFRFFREKYNLWFRPDYYDEMREYDYRGSIYQLGRHSSLASLDNCKTVEELEAKCIDKLIEIVKNK